MTDTQTLAPLSPTSESLGAATPVAEVVSGESADFSLYPSDDGDLYPSDDGDLYPSDDGPGLAPL